MDFIGAPEVATQKLGHVLDLTFSNIPFAYTPIRADLHCGSDYETQVTIIPSRGTVPLDQFNYRIPEYDLPKFAGLVNNGMASLPDPWNITCPRQLDSYAKALAKVFSSIIQTVSKPDHGGGSPAAWWIPEYKEAY
jgi:hypothetical protein